MSTLIKYFLGGVLAILIYLGYLYSQKVFVDGKDVDCILINDRFANGLENAFDYLYKCNVSFKLTNLTGGLVEAAYSVRNIDIKHGNRSKVGTVRLSPEESGSIVLKPRESRRVRVVVGSDFDGGTMRIKAWAND